jgi:type II secretory pathway pseudopilin PulG
MYMKKNLGFTKYNANKISRYPEGVHVEIDCHSSLNANLHLPPSAGHTEAIKSTRHAELVSASCQCNLPERSRNKFGMTSKALAFTLAEVLIVLGIIGIIAEITIPTLISNVHDAQYKAGAKKAYSVASQAVMQMKADNGDDLSAYAATTRSFVADFEKYFKSPRDCSYDICVNGEDTSSVYKNLVKGNANTGYMDDGQFETPDGMFWGIENYAEGGIGIAISVDVNGYRKKPNQFGKDVYMFQIVNNQLYPMGAPNTYLTVANGWCGTVDNSMQGAGCMYNVMQGIDY